MPAGQPKTAFERRNTAADVWYTLLDYNGSGMFGSVNIHTEGLRIDYLTIKITVDGGVPWEQNLGADLFWTCIQRDYDAARNHLAILTWGMIAFADSLKIEYKSVDIHDIKIIAFYQTT